MSCSGSWLDYGTSVFHMAESLEVVKIRTRKTGHERYLPVPGRLGEAVVRYLTASRPQTGERTLIVRFAHMCGESF